MPAPFPGADISVADGHSLVTIPQGRPGKDFTRTHILHLERVVWLNITLFKSTICVELDRFFGWLNTGEFSPTKSALVQALKQIKVHPRCRQ